MTSATKIICIRIIHTLIWVFFNIVIGYMLYSVIVNRLDTLFWIGLGFVFLEGLVLLLFKWTCPLTLLARKYSASQRDNFDIYLPNWLAKHTKTIYTTIAVLIVLFALVRLLH